VVCADAKTDQLLALMRLRDVAAELKELDRTGDQPARAQDLRARLRDLHTAYTTTYGPLSRPRQSRLAASERARDRARAEARPVREDERGLTAWGWFREDPDAATVLALESWDRAREVPVPSEVLTHRPGTRGNGLDRTDDPKVALTAVMGATGRVDLDRIADLLGTDPQQARRRLGTEVFDDPATGQLEHAGSYLSGAVRAKLDQARQAAASDPTYAVNVAALELVQPAPKRIGQFTPQLGAHWVPAGVVQSFLRDYLADPTLQVDHDDRYGWSVYAGKVPDAVNAVKGTDRRSALQIARAVLGRGSLTVEDTTPSGTAVVHEVNEDASRAARQKADAMRSAFEEYVTADSGG
jgi:N12 class adenine-specific DNA methylase